MRRFEYGRLHISLLPGTSWEQLQEWLPHGQNSERHRNDMLLRLNELGNEGWDLVGVGGGDSFVSLWLKRERAEQ